MTSEEWLPLWPSGSECSQWSDIGVPPSDGRPCTVHTHSNPWAQYNHALAIGECSDFQAIIPPKLSGSPKLVSTKYRLSILVQCCVVYISWGITCPQTSLVWVPPMSFTRLTSSLTPPPPFTVMNAPSDGRPQSLPLASHGYTATTHQLEVNLHTFCLSFPGNGWCQSA